MAWLQEKKQNAKRKMRFYMCCLFVFTHPGRDAHPIYFLDPLPDCIVSTECYMSIDFHRPHASGEKAKCEMQNAFLYVYKYQTFWMLFVAMTGVLFCLNCAFHKRATILWTHSISQIKVDVQKVWHLYRKTTGPSGERLTGVRKMTRFWNTFSYNKMI
jgi:hypothetical protein